MNALKNVKEITEYYADCPASFEEQVDGNMAYANHGENDFWIDKAWVAEAEPEFKTHEIHQALVKFFEEHPDANGIVLQN